MVAEEVGHPTARTGVQGSQLLSAFCTPQPSTVSWGKDLEASLGWSPTICSHSEGDHETRHREGVRDRLRSSLRPDRDGSQEEGRGEERMEKGEGEEGRAKVLEKGGGQRGEEMQREGGMGLGERVCREKGEACRKLNGGKACEGFGKRGAGKLRGARRGGPKDAGGGRACRSPSERSLPFSPEPPDSRGRSPPRGGPRTHFLTRPRPLLKGTARPASSLKPQPARNTLPSQACVCAQASSRLRRAPCPGIVGGDRPPQKVPIGAWASTLLASLPPPPPALSCPEAELPPTS